MFSRLFSRTLVIALVALTGCTDGVVDPRTQWLEENYSGVIQFTRDARRSAGDHEIDDRIDASFSEYSASGLHAGALTVNGRRIRVDSTAVNGLPAYRYVATTDIDDLTIPFGGVSLEVAATGSDRIPAFSDSIRTPEDEARIESPEPNAVVRQSDGLVIRWTPTSDRRTKATITLASTDAQRTVHTLFFEVHDTGEYRVAAEALGRAFPGRLGIFVERVVSRPITIKGNRRVLLSVVSRGIVTVDLAR
jgi:hypothetical protein